MLLLLYMETVTVPVSSVVKLGPKNDGVSEDEMPSSAFGAMVGSRVGADGGGGGGSTFRVNGLCVAVPTGLVAVKLIVYGEAADVPAAGVPLSVPVPLKLSTKLTPPGSVPISVSVIGREPDVWTVKAPGVPSPNVTLLALVMAGGASTTWVIAGYVPFEKFVSPL